ncbi:hypothetical protein FBZ84_102253 [Azospirillum baldaniorum]|uniref:hypothetical protein n=1 Tax=Azospirillum baldaniorum TaxID=1064539 RepID=UPI0011A457EA|nr:hypothetical protein [Azospirillum baldaniorum]TWA70703.1 hypothetical protein FBZ84_102253 [Azospirillum baldaniorum]
MADIRDSRDEIEDQADAELERKNKTLQGVLIVLSVLALFFMLIVYAEYFNYFGSIGVIGEFEKEKAAYGQFGDFFGGTLNPILAFMSFIAVLYTVSLQVTELNHNRKELRASREIAKQQKEHFENEARKSEILQALSQYEKEYENLLDYTFFHPRGYTVKIRDQISEITSAIESGGEINIRYIESILINESDRKKFKSCGIFLSGIDKLLGDYKEVSQFLEKKNESPPLIEYYNIRYSGHAVLFSHWKNLSIFSFRNLN